MYDISVGGSIYGEGCNKRNTVIYSTSHYKQPDDPIERHDIKDEHPHILKKMRRLKKQLAQSEAPSIHKPDSDKGNPSHFNNTFATGWC